MSHRHGLRSGWSRCPSALAVFCSLLLTFSAGALPAAGADSGGPVSVSCGRDPGAALIDYDAATGNLAVRAEQCEVGTLLRALAERAGIGADVGPGVSGTATLAFSGLSLEEGISRILEAAGARNLAAEFTKVPGEQGAAFRVEKISVHERAATAALLPRQTSSPGASPQREQQFRQRGGAPAGGLGRQPGIASLDPGLPALGAGEPAPDFPEPVRTTGGRKLQLRGSEQQVRSLLRAARRGDLRAIRLLGRIGDPQAAPALAKIATRSPEGSPARTAAAAALRQLMVGRRTP